MQTIEQFVSSEIAALRDMYFKVMTIDCSDKRCLTLLDIFKESFYINLEVVKLDKEIDQSNRLKCIKQFETVYNLFVSNLTP